MLFVFSRREKKKREERAENVKADEAITKCAGDFLHSRHQQVMFLIVLFWSVRIHISHKCSVPFLVSLFLCNFLLLVVRCKGLWITILQSNAKNNFLYSNEFCFFSVVLTPYLYDSGVNASQEIMLFVDVELYFSYSYFSHSGGIHFFHFYCLKKHHRRDCLCESQEHIQIIEVITCNFQTKYRNTTCPQILLLQL